MTRFGEMPGHHDRGAKGQPPSVDVFWIDDQETDATTSEALTMSEVSRRLRVPARAIREYQRRGLLGPRHGETFVFDRADRRRIAAIARARRLGFTLTEIKDLFCAGEGRATAQAVRLNLDRCERRIATLARQRADIEQALVTLRQIHDRLSARLTN